MVESWCNSRPSCSADSPGPLARSTQAIHSIARGRKGRGRCGPEAASLVSPRSSPRFSAISRSDLKGDRGFGIALSRGRLAN